MLIFREERVYSEQLYKLVQNRHSINNYAIRNAIYRGKNLGEFTDDHLAAIKDGTFTDMFLGDYFTINSRSYLIAGFKYFENTGLALVRTGLSAAECKPYGTTYNTEAVGTEGEEGYIPSTMNNPYATSNWYANVRPLFIEQAESIFGADNLKSYKIAVPTSPGQVSSAGYTFLESKAHLPTISMLTGWHFRHPRYRDNIGNVFGGEQLSYGYGEYTWPRLPVFNFRMNSLASLTQAAESISKWTNTVLLQTSGSTYLNWAATRGSLCPVICVK